MSAESPCCVYVIQAAAGVVKIGIAANVDTRLRDLQVANHHELKVLYKLEVANRHTAQALETLLHDRYASDSIRGEWFSINAERLIEDIRFASAFAQAIRVSSVEVAPRKTVKKATTQQKYVPVIDPNPVIHLTVAELDVVARWAIEQDAVSVSSVLDEFHISTPRAKAILHTFWKHNCLRPVEGRVGHYRYAP